MLPLAICTFPDCPLLQLTNQPAFLYAIFNTNSGLLSILTYCSPNILRMV